MQGETYHGYHPATQAVLVTYLHQAPSAPHLLRIHLSADLAVLVRTRYLSAGWLSNWGHHCWLQPPLPAVPPVPARQSRPQHHRHHPDAHRCRPREPANAVRPGCALAGQPLLRSTSKLINLLQSTAIHTNEAWILGTMRNAG